jgi:hypothetical protein
MEYLFVLEASNRIKSGAQARGLDNVLGYDALVPVIIKKSPA